RALQIARVAHDALLEEDFRRVRSAGDAAVRRVADEVHGARVRIRCVRRTLDGHAVAGDVDRDRLEAVFRAVFVDLAVAVVVQTVGADFFLRKDRALARAEGGELAVQLADLDALRADADAGCARRARVTRPFLAGRA